MTDFWNIIINGDTKAVRDVYGNVYDQNLNMVNEYTVTFTRKETDYIDWESNRGRTVLYLDPYGRINYSDEKPPYRCLVIARRGQTPEKLYKVGEKSETTKTATYFLNQAKSEQSDRSVTYDSPQGERSMGKTVAMFNALTGFDLTEQQGWQFMEILKMVRSNQGKYKADNFVDGCSYASLAGEAASRFNSEKGE